MITVVAKCYIKKEEIFEMTKLCKQLVEETKKEDGCISYKLFQNTKDDSIFTFIEKWDSKDSLEKHMNSAHFNEILPQIKRICYKDGEVEEYSLVF